MPEELSYAVWLRMQRARLHMSQSDLAELVDVHYGVISIIERGKVLPCGELARAIHEAVGCKTEQGAALEKTA